MEQKWLFGMLFQFLIVDSGVQYSKMGTEFLIYIKLTHVKILKLVEFKGKELILVILAFAAIYIIWGTTYLAVRIAVETIPPFAMASVRFVVAGLMLFIATLFFFKGKRPTLLQLRNSAITGILLLSIGTGGVAWGLQYVDSGVTALLVAGQPLLTTMLVWAMLKKKPVLSSYMGIVLGIIGMIILIGQDQLIGQQSSLMGIAVIFLAMLCWSIGSIFVKKMDLPEVQLQSAALQMIFAGLVLMLFSTGIQELNGFSLQAVSWDSFLALIYLILLGSLVGYSSFNYLLKRVSPEKVSTSTYVNPVVALFLGWWVKNETLTHQSLWAAAIMLMGVLFINVDMFAEVKKYRRRLEITDALKK